MNILIAPNAFKGTLSAKEVADGIEEGIREVSQNHNIRKLPIADGGDGTLEVLLDSLGCERHNISVPGPSGTEIFASYGYNPISKTGLVELAESSGLRLLNDKELSPDTATTFGTGLILKELIRKGANEIYFGVGGSASIDGGTGILEALGMKFHSDSGAIRDIRPESFFDITSISWPKKMVYPKIKILSDVNNYLLGKEGAVRVFGSQKGLGKDQFQDFENRISHWAEVVFNYSGLDIRKLEGGGASGGVPAGLYPFLPTTIVPGAETIFEIVGLEKQLNWCDYLITGEGRIDIQTIMGKGPGKIAERAKKSRKKVIGFCGTHEADLDWGGLFDSIIASSGDQKSSEWIKNGRKNLVSSSSKWASAL